MGRITAALFVGLVAGIIVALAAPRLGIIGGQQPGRIMRDIVDVAPMGYADAIRHRDNHFAELQTIESLQALPSEFDRGEALYALSGRSDASGLQSLAFDARRIVDPVWRERALGIVFFRLTEVDPSSALALARSDYFSSVRNVETRVWRTWARMDLMAAIEAAQALDSKEKYAAAQMIFSGVGGAYTNDAKVVEGELGIRPATSNRATYLRDLVGLSPEDALTHVLALESKKRRHEQIKWLADLLAREDLAEAEEFADSIDDVDLRRRYLAAIYDRLARENPEEAFEKQFANRAEGKISAKEKEGFKKLAKSDLDRALRLIDSLADTDNRAAIATIIATRYAKEDPIRALEWARAESKSEFSPLVRAVITSFAAEEPELALREAERVEDSRERSQLTMVVIDTVLESSPKDAARHVGNISDESNRARAAQSVAREWLAEDAAAAVDWLLSGDPKVRDSVFNASNTVASMDLSEAQVILTSLPSEYRGPWARGVAKRLVDERSAEEAMRFVSQFEGQPDYDMQMAHLVTKVANTDGALAVRWAERIPRGNARDAALSNIIAAEARREPAAAAEWLQQISDPDLRQVSAGEVVRRWYKTEPEAASQWLNAMPRGADRDNVIMNTATSLSRDSDKQLRLIESIDDSEKRKQAMFMRTISQNRDDPDELIRQLDAMEMPDMFKQQIKAQILRGAARGN